MAEVYQEEVMLPLMRRGLAMSSVLCRFVNSHIKEKLGRRFKKLDFTTFKKIVKENAPELLIAKRTKKGILRFKVEFYKDVHYFPGYAIAEFIVMPGHLWGEARHYGKLLAVLKEELNLDGEKFKINGNLGWDIHITLADEYYPVKIGPFDGCHMYKAIKEIKKFAPVPMVVEIAPPPMIIG